MEDLENIWSDKDPYNSGFRMVEQKRLSTSRKVCDTQTIFVNGVKLNPTPLTTDAWMGLVDDLVAKQV